MKLRHCYGFLLTACLVGGFIGPPTLIIPGTLVGPGTSLFASEPPESEVWPKWRGPRGTGVAVGANPPDRWDAASGKNIRWKTRLPGRGHGTPIVWADRIYVTSATAVGPKLPARSSGRPGAHDNLAVDSEHRFDVIAIDRRTGEVRWQRTVNRAVPLEGGHRSASLASASPVTDGRRVYAFFGTHGLFCLDRDGTTLWSKQFGTMHTKHGHGDGASPVLHGDTVVINWDHEEQSFIVAMDKFTGNEIWRRRRKEVTSWSTPLVVEVGGRVEVVVCGTDRVRGYDLDTGEIIWQCGGLSANIVATPVFADGVVYVGSSYDTRAMMAIRIDGAAGDLTGSDRVLWSRTRGTPYVPSPLLYDDTLYFLSHYQNVLTRVEAATGSDRPGPIRLGPLGNIYASPVGAGGRVYVTDRAGVTAVLTDTEIPRMIAVNALGESVSASAAIVGDEIFLRGDRHLFCIAEDET